MSSHTHTHTHLIYTLKHVHTLSQTPSHTLLITRTHTHLTYTLKRVHTLSHTPSHTLIFTHTHTHTHTLLHIWRGPRWLLGILGRGRQPNSIFWQVRTFLLKALFDL